VTVSPVLILVLLILTLLVLLFIKWAWIPSSRVPRHRVRHHHLRLRLRLYPGRGHATIAELWLRWGRFAAYCGSGRTRRSLTWWERLAAGPWSYSVFLGRAHHRHGMRAGLEEHLLVLAAPRTGKTGWLGRMVLHYPGPVVSTTTKHDMFALTSGVRAQLGPVHVFNPQQVGNVASTLAWNPIEGCHEPAVAIRRADAFAQSVSQKGVEEGSFWTAKASDVLRAFFCAAALSGGDMRMVGRWALSGSAAEAEAILTAHGSVYEEWAGVLAEMRGEAKKTAATIKMTLSRAVGFMADPALAASCLPGPAGGFDIEAFTRSRGTLYLIAETRGEDSPVAPLFACLTAEIHYTAALTGSRSPSGRLDPPLLMALDEVTQICPVPVPSWLADSGGKGIQLAVVCHGEAQLRERWGKDGARVILDTCGIKMILPGVSDTDTLRMASQLSGQHGNDEAGRFDVLTPAMISQLPPRFALVLRAGMAPVVASLKMVWRDRDYKRARRRGNATAVLSLPLEASAPQPVRVTTTGTARPQAWPAQSSAGQADPEPWLGPRADDRPAAHVPDINPAQFPWTRR
jgi:type IV secretion system protein VirD4